MITPAESWLPEGDPVIPFRSARVPGTLPVLGDGTDGVTFKVLRGEEAGDTLWCHRDYDKSALVGKDSGEHP